MTERERRRSKRLKVELVLEISSLFKQDNVKVNKINSPIEVVDISRTGIGFISISDLPLGYYFNASIQLGDADSILYTVVKIIREEQLDDSLKLYGCEFVGLAPVLMYIFDDYEKHLSELDKRKGASQ